MSSLSIGSLVTRFAGNLRYPWLVAITGTILLLDIVLLDPLPFIDEIVFALLTLIFMSFKERKPAKDAAAPAAAAGSAAAPSPDGVAQTDTPEKREATVISVEPNP